MTPDPAARDPRAYHPEVPLAMAYIDTHVHLDQEEFDADRDAVLDRADRAGLEAVVCVGTTASSSRAVLRLSETYPAVYAAVGIQPSYCADAGEDDWQEVVQMAGHRRVVALGETGLDRHWDFAPMDRQQDFFDRHLRLAGQLGLPVVVHCREAEADLVPMLREAAARQPLRGVIHCFSGDAAMAAECLELGLYLSFAGAVTYRNRKFGPLREVAASVPADRLLIETDSPYLVPEPLRGRQTRNEPAYLVHTAECLAGLRGVGAAELAAQTTENARRLFRLPPG